MCIMHKIDIINHEMVAFTRRDYQALKLLNYHIEKLLSLDNEKYILHCEQYSITVNYINHLCGNVLEYNECIMLLKQIDQILGVFQ